MNPIYETRSPRNGANRARANQVIRNKAERLDNTETLKDLQAKRLRSILGCTEATALTLAVLAYGEAKR